LSTDPPKILEPDGPDGEPALSRVRAERRRALLDAALRVFLREGYQGATMEGVAEEAGVSRQTLYNYVDDKEELFIALVEERKIGAEFEQLQQALELIASADTEAGLRAAVGLLLERCSDTEMTGLFRLLVEVAQELPDVMARVRERVFRRGIEAVHAALDHGVAAGRLRPVDADVVAHVIFGVASSYGLIAPALLGDWRVPPERMAAGFADLLTHGLTAAQNGDALGTGPARA
jgi:TetR/AcrR family transcriptional repressor of mexJK operon